MSERTGDIWSSVEDRIETSEISKRRRIACERCEESDSDESYNDNLSEVPPFNHESKFLGDTAHAVTSNRRIEPGIEQRLCMHIMECFEMSNNLAWSTEMDTMIFEFAAYIGGTGSRCVSDARESGYSRFQERVKQLHYRDYHIGLESEIPELDHIYYIANIRKDAMDHVQRCFELGEIYGKYYQDGGTTRRKEKVLCKPLYWPFLDGFISKPIYPHDSLAIHSAISCLQQHKKSYCKKYTFLPTEPFMLFGISVKCCELEDIFYEEDTGATYVHEVATNASATAVISFLENDVFGASGHGGRFMGDLISSVEDYKHRYPTKWERKLEESMNSSTDAYRLFFHLRKFIKLLSEKVKTAKHIKEDRRKRKIEDIADGNELTDAETFLRKFVTLVLRLDGDADELVEPRCLSLFKKTLDSEKPMCKPDITYNPFDDEDLVVIVDKAEKMMMRNVGINTVNIEPALVWRIFEQLLSEIEFSCQETHNSVVYRGGMLIVNDKIRSVVLAMEVDVYKTIKKFNKLSDLIAFIKNIRPPRKDWCRIYIERSEHSIWHIIQRAKVIHKNFTNQEPV